MFCYALFHFFKCFVVVDTNPATMPDERLVHPFYRLKNCVTGARTNMYKAMGLQGGAEVSSICLITTEPLRILFALKGSRYLHNLYQ